MQDIGKYYAPTRKVLSTIFVKVHVNLQSIPCSISFYRYFQKIQQHTQSFGKREEGKSTLKDGAKVTDSS